MFRVPFLLLSLSFFCSVSYGAEVALTGPEISAVLSDAVLTGEDHGQASRQIFQSNGSTYFSAGAGQSQGRWKVEGDQFCSLWPPNPDWACYDVRRDDQHIIFISKFGDRTDMVLAK